MGLPKPKQRVKVKAKPSVESPSNSSETVQTVRPKRKVATSEATAMRVKTNKFDENHVRWTGYLTVSNNRYLRYLLAQGQIPSITRCVNDAVEDHLKKRFGLPSEHDNND
jgi:hypothetical protein